MRSDYHGMYRSLQRRLWELGASLISEHELDATFSLRSGWVLTFVCEKYYGPGFMLTLRPPGENLEYSISALMDIFSRRKRVDYGLPTIDHQIDFVIRESDTIFGDREFYEDDYRRLNDCYEFRGGNNISG
ncbi:hypothetical protein [Luteimonas sp. e5]